MSASRSFTKLVVIGRAGFPALQTTATCLRGLASQHAVPMEIEVKEKDRASYMRMMDRVEKETGIRSEAPVSVFHNGRKYVGDSHQAMDFVSRHWRN